MTSVQTVAASDSSGPMTLQRMQGSAVDRAALEQLMQLYVYDFSEFWRPEQRVDLREDGKFPPYPGLDEYWSAPDRSVWFMHVGTALSGFALLNKRAHSLRPVDFNVAEFFVARPYRRTGVGTHAIVSLLKQHPGVWEAAISARNLPAQAFWPRAISRGNIADLETLQGDGVEWTGPILRFKAL